MVYSTCAPASIFAFAGVNVEETNEAQYEPGSDEAVNTASDAAYAAGPQLTVADGFRFGFGFFLAGLALFFVAAIAATLAYLIALVTGSPIPDIR